MFENAHSLQDIKKGWVEHTAEKRDATGKKKKGRRERGRKGEEGREGGRDEGRILSRAILKKGNLNLFFL